MNKNILFCIRNGLMSDGIINMITNTNKTITIIEEHDVALFNSSAEFYKPDIIVIEVKDIKPYTLTEWLVRVNEVREHLPKLKVAMIVDDENYPQTAKAVKQVKSNGDVDAFFYTSAGLKFLVDTIETL